MIKLECKFTEAEVKPHWSCKICNIWIRDSCKLYEPPAYQVPYTPLFEDGAGI